MTPRVAAGACGLAVVLAGMAIAATGSGVATPGVTTPGAAITATPSVTLPPDLARILTDYEGAWRAKDAAALAALFAEEGFVLSSGDPPVRGRAAIERLYAGRGGPLALRAIDYRVEGSVGYILGGFARHPGEPDLGKFTLTIVQGVGGRWFIQSDMDNGNGSGGSAGGSPTLAAPGAAPAAAIAPAQPAAATTGAAKTLLDRAVNAAGGRRALEGSPAFRWKGTAAAHAGGRDLALAGTWRLVPPRQARVETWERLRGPESTRTLVLDGATGWTAQAGKTERMAPALLAREAAQFHLYSLMRLVPLRGPECGVTALGSDAAGREGLHAVCAGYPDADLLFDADARLVRIVTRLTDPATGREVVETADLDGMVESRGVRWPRTVHLAWDGEPYFELEILEFEAIKSLDPATFAPPP